LFVHRQDDPRWPGLMKYYDGLERVSGIRVEEWGFFPNEGEPWAVKAIQFVTTPSLEHDDQTYFILAGPVPGVYYDDGQMEIN